MRKNTYKINASIIIIFFIGCSANPKPIKYGSDNCEFCEMTIVDDKHSSEVVTKKGKIYKFDSIECMVEYVIGNPNLAFKFLLIADLHNPGKLIDAKSGFYLISDKLPSPMGENLSGFSMKLIAVDYQNNYGGKIYTWQEINVYIDNK